MRTKCANTASYRKAWIPKKQNKWLVVLAFKDGEGIGSAHCFFVVVGFVTFLSLLILYHTYI
jgi:hypothetical protein